MLAWTLFWLPFVVLGVLAATFDRDLWPSLLGDEAVYLMAAQSLSYDHDLSYSLADRERFEATVQRVPDGLILQSSDGGETLVYGKPWLYPAAIAPFVRLSPGRGAVVANTVYLLLAALLTCWALAPVLGASAPAWVACFVFASVTMGHVFWTHSDLFMMSLVAAGCALVVQPWLLARAPRRLALNAELGPASRTLGSIDRDGTRVPLILAGTSLLALVVTVRPYYLPILLLPLVVALPGGRPGFRAGVATESRGSRRRWAWVVATALATLLAVVAVDMVVRGEWSSYSGERQSFYSYTGFPEAASDPGWGDRVAERGGNSWTEDGLLPFPIEARQTAWNLLYFFVGRHVGLVPYFLPFLLGLLAFRADRSTLALAFALAAISALFLVARPFNFYGGGGALANRYFLPIYPLCWFLIRRRISWVWPVLVTALAALFLLPLWTTPRSFWRAGDGSYFYVSRVAERWLPYETTQKQLKPSNREDFNYQVPTGSTLWMKPLSARVSSPDGGLTLQVTPGHHTAEVLVATASPQRGFRLQANNGSEPTQVRFSRPTARHRMWWTMDDLYLYRFDLDRVVPESMRDSTSSIIVVPMPAGARSR